jgi:hypothetical protein
MQAAMLALYAGRHAEARERLTALCAGARDRGDASDVPFALLWRSWLETRCAILTPAEDVVDEAILLAAMTGSPSTRGWLCAQRAYVRAHRGEEDGTRSDCAQAQALLERSGYKTPRIWIAAASRSARSVVGPACGGVGGMRVAGGRGPGARYRRLDLPVLRSLAVEAMILCGRADPAQALLAAYLEPARRLDCACALATGGRCTALLLAARGDVAGAAAAARAALVEHDRIDAPFELGRTLLVTGVIHRRERKRGAAKASIERALGSSKPRAPGCGPNEQ